ncbi:MAG: M1 family metallopeptidase [Sphingobacteriales bacterium]|nr:MAG: M1 family metallopeptidase [Sphingobacteriales bacterium]
MKLLYPFGIYFLLCFYFSLSSAYAQQTPLDHTNTSEQTFKQLDHELPTPNTYRTASGSPGHQYWQQRADYEIQIELDDNRRRIDGSQTVTYYNSSPDILTYIWLQLDQNQQAKTSDTYATESNAIKDDLSFNDFQKLHLNFDGGFKIESLNSTSGGKLNYTINKTMMRIDLPEPLKPGGVFSFKMKWWYNINDRMKMGGRSGYEYFSKDDNCLYTIAQFYPRLAAYLDYQGWQHKQFLGAGEFTLSFGNYKVSITAPADMVVAATGVLQNPNETLNAEQKQRLEKSKTAKEPVFIITAEEALKQEKSRVKDKKTWIFKAEDVRDFAFAASRKFIWDAMGVPMSGKTVMAMSYYPKEGNPLWEQYSTKVVAHTLKTYSKYTFDYPYPVAISVHADKIGMEYPMICFNFGRPESDGTYSARTKYGMIGVIIHEVGHNYFPMIVNSDERQWTWMDEGLNSFLQYLTEQEWEKGFPSRRGPAPNIVNYMKGDKNGQMSIMTNSESILQFGNNAYGKPATALNILRESIMGRELFDFAFKEYANRWKFKHPTPADFFRTMEDASAVDLDWFWRGWFYSTDHVDISLDEIKWFKINTRNPDIEKAVIKDEKTNAPKYITDLRNEDEQLPRQLDSDPSLADFYNRYDSLVVTEIDRSIYQNYLNTLNEEEKQLLQQNFNYYELSFSNIGGLVMPLIIEFAYTDGSKEIKRIPAEIWRKNDKTVSKVFITQKELIGATLDPFLETADCDLSNNSYPPKQQISRFQLYKNREREGKNIMKEQKK